jgi:CRISPR-associated endonuclease Csn1
MKKILGLDLGVATIGWAVTNESDENFEILGMGTRIVPYNLNNQTELSEFQQGKSYTTNQNRREKLGARVNSYRYKLRKYQLIEFLTKFGMLPTKELFGLDALSLYGLRAKAIKEQISLQEIGRIFFHLNQKRGYRSSRKTGQNEKSDYLNNIKAFESELLYNQQTVGEYFFEQLSQNPHFQVKKKILYRHNYISEFEKIYATQVAFYPTILTDDNLLLLRDKIIYHQRPLKSQKGTVSECRYEKNLKAAPKSSPLFQLAKIWQSVNTLMVEDKWGNQTALSLSQKRLIVAELDKTEELTAARIKKILGISREFSLNTKALQGNITKIKLQKVLADRPNLLIFNDFTNLNEQPLYRLWHLLYSVDEKEFIYKKLIETPYNISAEQAQYLAEKISFPQGYGSLSSKALKKILPYLEQGEMYSMACELAGYKHSDSETTAECEVRELLPELALIKKNSLRNPIVEKIVNQVVNVVNAIINDPELGRPDEIRIELARHLKDNAERRRKTEENNRKAEKLYKEYEAELLKTFPNFRRVSRKDIEKYRLWLEFKGISPYEPTKCINLSELFSGEYEVEHIIPKARLFDDSFTNKTLARRKINQQKNDLTAFDFMESLSEQAFHDYKELIAKADISRAKREKLLMRADDIPQDFIERQLRETQYITKTVKELLSQVCRNVTTTTGGITDYLRHDWGLDSILQDLNWGKYEAANQVEDFVEESANGRKHHKKRIINWSKRDDHRNHAIDALVVACTKQSHVQQLNKLNQLYDNQKDLKESGRKFKKPLENLTAIAKEAVASILVSYKAGKKVATWKKDKKHGGVMLVPRGALHEETVYGKLNDKYTVRYELGVNFDKADKIVDEQVKKMVFARLEKYGNDPKKAFKNLENEPVWWNEAQGIKIVKVKCWANLKNAETLRTNQENEGIAFVKSGNNHHVAIYENTKGKKFEKVVSLWEAVERKKQGLPVVDRTPSDGSKLIVSMQINESFVFGMGLDELKKAIIDHDYKLISKNLYRVQKLTSSDYWFRLHSEANIDDSKVAKDILKFISIRSPSNLDSIKVKINHLGRIEIVNE